MKTIREKIEIFEKENLSRFATLSINSKGRLRKEKKCEIRTEFQRDRDRIIHSRAFRRLKHKTQVFIALEQDHYRTRLTHTLEVTQIARTISRALGLNEDLTEAIALGHDLGHTPFGHMGEKILDELVKRYIPTFHFKHYEQSIRVVDFLENEGKGLNLTYEVRDGIEHHSKGRADLEENLDISSASTLEGEVVRFADRIAYLNHDIADAIRAEIIKGEEIPREIVQILGDNQSARIDTMVKDIIYNSENKPHIMMSKEILRATNELKEFLFKRVYLNPLVLKKGEMVNTIMENLFEFYLKNPSLLPPNFKPPEENLSSYVRTICDYISGMTDRYALRKYQELFNQDFTILI